jgi:hypothetical protein
VLVELDDDAVDAVQVAGVGVMVDPHSVADVEHRERFGGVDCLQQLIARVDGVGDRGQVRVEVAGGDLVEQQSLGLGRLWWRAGR